MRSRAFEGAKATPARKGSLFVCLLVLACAGSPRPRPEAEPRVKDSVPDKLAAQRAASGELRLEDEDERWGIEAARSNRKTKTDQQKQPSPP
jgi:hypothetical protein